MTSAAALLHYAAVAALRASAALTSAGIDSDRDVTVEAAQGQALPYVIMQGPTDSEEQKTSTSTVSSATVSLTAFATTLQSAMQIADIAGQVLADRDNPLTIAGHTVLGSRVELQGPPQQDPGTEAARPWGMPLRVRYDVTRST